MRDKVYEALSCWGPSSLLGHFGVCGRLINEDKFFNRPIQKRNTPCLPEFAVFFHVDAVLLLGINSLFLCDNPKLRTTCQTGE